MEDILLLDAIERYKKGEMSVEEQIFFEELRKNNPEVDHMVVEHLHFLKQMEGLSGRKALKATLNSVHNKLVTQGAIVAEPPKGKGKVVYLWNRYRRTITVAASIALLVSIFTAGMIASFTDSKKTSNLTPLVDNKLNNFEHKLNVLENKLNRATTPVVPSKPTFVANFRATGFLIDGRGYIVTNAHVINNANNLIVENSKGDQYVAVPVYVNKGGDLAILKVTDTTFKKIKSLPYSIPRGSAELGAHIFTLGYPREDIVYGEGYLSSKSGYSGDTASYQVSISVNPGNSGGPVINRNGEVIGIISSKETNADGVVFALKSKNIYNAVKELSSTDVIKLPSNSTMKNMDREEQIKKIQDYVFMIKGN
jgi:serine protease Do